jgi:hypothetical protein
MSITYELKGSTVSDSVVALSNLIGMKKFVSANWSLIEQRHDVESGVFLAKYHLNGSGKEYPVHLIVTSTVGNIETYNKVQFSSWIVVSDSVTGLDTYLPQTIFLAWKHAGSIQREVLSCLYVMQALTSTSIEDHATVFKSGNAIRKLNDGDGDVLNDMYTDDAE